jgi:outer membrane protein assembly factor BamC
LILPSTDPDEAAARPPGEMYNVNRIPTLATVLALACALAACSSTEGLLTGDKIDYRSQANKTPPLEVPPDLSQLARDSRYQPQGGTVSASALLSPPPAPAASAVPTVAPLSVGELRIERSGDERWLVTPLSPEQLWPQLRAFWQERGFNIVVENAQAGVLETDWAENRAKLPQDILRTTLGRLVDTLYSTGERDKFRTRVERTASGSEIYISHRGLQEVYVSVQQDQTMWTNRPADRQLEAEFLSMLMVKLGAKPEEARRVVAAAPPAAPARAHLVDGQPAALRVDEAFERAWRRVGLALDRSGFTVEDRDRSAGTYFVRYVSSDKTPKEDRGFFSRLFSKDDANTGVANRYRIALKGEGEATMVSVLDAQGAPERTEVGQRIVALLVEDLK